VTDLTGWTPIRVGVEDGRPLVDWCWTEGVAFDDPFFDQTVDGCLHDPYRLLFRRRTSIDVLAEWAQSSPGLPLAGLVLHLSRCGSTLVTQMLAARGDVRVMSEPGPFDALMRFPAPVEERAQWLRWLVSALGQPTGGQRRLAIKLDSWAALDLAVIDAAFPDVPRVFLYREAVEVLVSQSGHRGYHMVPGTLPPSLLGLVPQQVATMSLEAYGAAVLGAIAGSAARAMADDDRLWIAVAYDELPSAVPDRIAPHFGLSTDETMRALMAAAAVRDAKNPALDFVEDSARKNAAATAEMLEECAARVDPVLNVLRSRHG
jgi:hypothetical protein